ncbi:MAG: hypothetical protein HYS06_04065 [Methylocystis sp.]|nr:hypothetical protein [Methylocystis sp.]MBI3274720.1 hypothetical protein [Methylocystis sp.]
MLNWVSLATHRFWIRWLRGRPANDVALDRAAAWHRTGRGALQKEQSLEFLYNMLSILDDKAQSLMQFNAFVTALIGLFWSHVSGKDAHWIYFWSATGTVLASLLSIFASLLVVGVFWRFLGLAVPDRTDAEQSVGAPSEERRWEAEIGNLCKVLRFRESAYQFAWLASLVSLFTLMPVVFGAFFQP